MTLDEICEAVRIYVESKPNEGGRYDRSWRDRLDESLADIRANLSTHGDRRAP